MGLMADTDAIRAFFDIYQRELGIAELRYFSSVFGVADAATADPYVRQTENSADDFHAQYRLSIRKWRRAYRVAHFLKLFPWISGVAIANTLSFLSVKESSDIDLFIICKPRRVWFTRLCVVGFLRLFHLRPAEASTDPVCPTFFIDEHHLDLSSIALRSGDSYLLCWLATLAPVWGDGAVWERFFAANAWALQRPACALQPVRGRGTLFLYRVLALGDGLFWERIAERIQRLLMPLPLRKASMRGDTHVVMREGMLKFHENDRRDAYHKQWLDNYAKRARILQATERV